MAPQAVVRRHSAPIGWFWVCPACLSYGTHLPAVTDAIDAACEHIRNHHTTTDTKGKP